MVELPHIISSLGRRRSPTVIGINCPVEEGGNESSTYGCQYSFWSYLQCKFRVQACYWRAVYYDIVGLAWVGASASNTWPQRTELEFPSLVDRCRSPRTCVHDSQDPFMVTSPRDSISSSPPNRMLKARTLPKADDISLAYIVENTYSTDSPILIVWWNASDLSPICL